MQIPFVKHIVLNFATKCCKITQGHAAQSELTVRGQGKSGDAATYGNAIDPILKLQGEPRVAASSGRDAERNAIG